MVNVAILGFGTVGSGVAEVIHKNVKCLKKEVRRHEKLQRKLCKKLNV